MMELYLSSDGKHTVHVSAETPDEMVKLLPQAKLVYEAVVRTYGTKAQMWTKQGNGGPKGTATVRPRPKASARRPCVLCTRRLWPTEKDGAVALRRGAL